MVEIYDIMNITCQNLYHMPYQPENPISPEGDIGVLSSEIIEKNLYNIYKRHK
jgi:hypothetical protein